MVPNQPLNSSVDRGLERPRIGHVGCRPPGAAAVPPAQSLALRPVPAMSPALGGFAAGPLGPRLRLSAQPLLIPRRTLTRSLNECGSRQRPAFKEREAGAMLLGLTPGAGVAIQTLADL